MYNILDFIRRHWAQVVYIVVGALICYVVAHVDVAIFTREPIIASAIAFMAMAIFAVIYQLLSFFCGRGFDKGDITCMMLGGIISLLIFLSVAYWGKALQSGAL